MSNPKPKYKSEVERTSGQFPAVEYAPVRIVAAQKGIGSGLYIRQLVRKHHTCIKRNA